MVTVIERAADIETSTTGGSGERPVARIRWHWPVRVPIAVRIGGGVWLATRVMYVLVTVVAVVFTQAGGARTAGDPLAHKVFSVHTLAWAWAQWDGLLFYLPIAQHGYTAASQTNFFPLYPLVVHVLLPLVGGPSHVLRAALGVSQLASLAAFIGLAALVLHQGGSVRVATLTVTVLVASPLAFFLAAPYPTALLLALAVWAWLAGQRGWWLAAALCVALATLTHPTGVALWLPLVMAYGRARWWGDTRRRWLSAMLATRGRPLWAAWREGARVVEAELVVLAGPLALGGYALWCQQRFGDRLAFVHSQEHLFNHQRLSPLATVHVDLAAVHSAPAGTYLQARLLVDVVPIVLALVVLVVVSVCVVRRQNDFWPLDWTLYVLGLLALFLAVPVVGTQFPDPVIGAGRYLLPVFPLWVALGRWAARWPSLETLLVGGGFALQAVLLAFYLNGGWLV